MKENFLNWPAPEPSTKLADDYFAAHSLSAHAEIAGPPNKPNKPWGYVVSNIPVRLTGGRETGESRDRSGGSKTGRNSWSYSDA